MTDQKIISYILRIAIAFAFIYPPIAAFINPEGWIWFVPVFVESVMPRELFLNLFGVVEIIIALGVLLMRNPFYPAIASIAILAIIIGYDLTIFDITFRDVSILLSAVALMFLHRRDERANIV
jgi:hypothetical protein